MKTKLYRASNLTSTITFLAFNSERKSISGAREKTVNSCDLFILIIITRKMVPIMGRASS